MGIAGKRIAIVGAGHNALVCACYLAEAGHDVTVLERRSRVGGAMNADEMWGDYQIDIASPIHSGGLDLLREQVLMPLWALKQMGDVGAGLI